MRAHAQQEEGRRLGGAADDDLGSGMAAPAGWHAGRLAPSLFLLVVSSASATVLLLHAFAQNTPLLVCGIGGNNDNIGKVIIPMTVSLAHGAVQGILCDSRRRPACAHE